MKKLLIDVSVLGNPKTGIQRYVEEIVCRFPNNKNIIYFSINEISNFKCFECKDVVDIKLPRYGKRAFFHLMGANILNRKFKFDIYWGTAFTVPMSINKGHNVVTTIYDMVPFKEEYVLRSIIKRKAKKWFIKKTIKYSEKIITISEYVANDIARFFKISEDRIIIAYPGIDRNVFKKKSEDKQLKVVKKYNLSQPFVLSLCSMAPRKNLKRVIEAFYKSKNKRLLLVLAGGILFDDGTLLYGKKLLGERLKYIGYVPFEDIPPLYSAANAFIAASLEEGFDMPPVEALACGTKVIASDIPVHREVLEDEVEYFEPTNVEELTKLINKIPYEKENIDSDIPKKFSWDSSSQKIYSMFEKLG